MLPSELHAVQETRGSKCVSIWEKQSGGLFRSECINPSVNACGVATSLYTREANVMSTVGAATCRLRADAIRPYGIPYLEHRFNRKK